MAKVSEIIRKLQERNLDEDIAYIFYDADDIRLRGKELGADLTSNLVQEVLVNLQKYRDSCDGLSWKVIDAEICHVYFEKTKKRLRKSFSGTREDIETYAPRG